MWIRLDHARAGGPNRAFRTLVGIDLSEPFIAAARSEAPSNVRYLCADAQTHTFESSFDLCFSRFGVMFFEDPAAAFANLCRALRPGGRFAVVAWESPEQNGWVEVPLRVLRAHLPAPPAAALAGPGPFSLADPVAFERLLAEAGFAQSRVQVLDLPYFAGATVQEAARLLLQLGPAAAVLREAGDEGKRLQPAVAADLCNALAPGRAARSRIAAAALLATAGRPDPTVSADGRRGSASGRTGTDRRRAHDPMCAQSS